MSHVFAAKAKTELGLTLTTTGSISGAVFSGPIGAVAAGTFSGAFQIVLNGISILGCNTYAKNHEKKNELNNDMIRIMAENDRLIKGKIAKLYVGWNKLYNDVNHKISNLAIPLKFINPLPYLSDKLFYHACAWVQTDLCENSDDGILIEYGKYQGNEQFNHD